MSGENDDDDFMGQIDSVISQAESSPHGTNVIDEPDFDFKSEKKPVDTSSEEILDLVDTPEEKLARKEAKENDKKKAAEQKPAQEQGKKPVDDNQGQQQQQQQQPAKETTPFLDRFLKQDEKGNLVLKDGTVIAMNGKSRAYYEGLKAEARSFRDNADKLALSSAQLARKFTELYEAHTELKNNSGITSIVKETGMSQSEVQEGLRLMKSYKANPIEAIKSLLTQARMSGIDLSSIGINGGIDPATIARAIEAAKDVQQEKQTQLSEAEKSQQTAEKTVDEFFARNPEALDHVEIIAQAADKFPNESLDMIWYKYKIWMRNQRAALSEQEFNNPQQQQIQKQEPINPQNNQRQITRVVNNPPRQYGAMSIDDIAASVKKDFING